MHDSFMSQDSKNRYYWSHFQHFGDTFSVYISSRLVENAKSRRSALHVMQSEFPVLQDLTILAGFSLASATPCLFGRCQPSPSLIHLFPHDLLLQTQQ